MEKKHKKSSKQTVLEKIAAATIARLIMEKQHISQEELASKVHVEDAAKEAAVFLEALKNSKSNYSIIAEVKRASPSKGDIAVDLDPVEVAKDYVANGASALSVLTEPQFFNGSLDYLKKIRQALPDTPILMKDFFVDEYQLYQAKQAGANAILIIVALLGKESSLRMLDLAKKLGLAALVEVHEQSELEIAEQIGAEIIGINSRNLKTLELSLENITNLLPKVKSPSWIVGESGIESNSDLKLLYEAGCRSFLVGSHLMASGQPGAALKDLLDTPCKSE